MSENTETPADVLTTEMDGDVKELFQQLDEVASAVKKLDEIGKRIKLKPKNVKDQWKQRNAALYDDIMSKSMNLDMSVSKIF